MNPLDRFRLDGRTALVTGASGGLGRHFALTLARAGARVAVGARRMDRLEETAELIRSEGGTAVPVLLDVTEPGAPARAFDEAEDALGTVTVLVNNAGVPSGSWFASMPESEWRRVLDVNLDGVFRVAQEAVRRMDAARVGGTIVNIASVLGFGVLKAVSAYAVSKAAVVQLTKTMALELARSGVRVNALAPGYFATDINRDFLESEAGAQLIARVPQARLGELADLEGALLLLASDAGSFMTGTVIAVDGGALLAMG